LDLAQVKAFLVLCEELHFGRTAERLHVSQPRVSRLVAGLEGEIGGALFARTSRRVALTPLGVQLRDRLAPAHEELTAALAAARTAARSPAGLLRLGFAATTAGSALDRLVVAFERTYPDCSVSLHEVALPDSYGPLEAGKVDVLTCWLVIDDPGLTVGPEIARYPRVLAVAVDHPLAREQSVSVEVLADYPVPNWDYRGLADRVRRAMVPSRTPSGRPVRVHSAAVRTVGEVTSLIARGQVVVPTVAMQHFPSDQIVLVPIRDMLPVPLGLIWRSCHENARIRALADVARSLSPQRAAQQQTWNIDRPLLKVI
jgi:DNA-binding transcriptional LysR family regulator